MTRIFSADKSVGGKEMNMLGVQAARTVVARLAYHARGVRPPSGMAPWRARLSGFPRVKAFLRGLTMGRRP